MRALVVYESMYGNTRAVAEAVAASLADTFDSKVKVASAVTDLDLDDCDLLVVGGPTHVHGLPRPTSRKAAAEAVAKSNGELVLEAGAQEPGLREWLAALGDESGAGKWAAAFDTRLSAPPLFTGRASLTIAKRLKRLGFAACAEPVSFLVDKQNRLLDGELDRAGEWGRQLGG